MVFALSALCFQCQFAFLLCRSSAEDTTAHSPAQNGNFWYGHSGLPFRSDCDQRSFAKNCCGITGLREVYATHTCPVLSCPVLSCIVLYCLVLSCPVLYCLVLSCPVLSCLVLSCLVLSCLVLSCLVLYCIVLYCIFIYLHAYIQAYTCTYTYLYNYMFN